MNGEISACRWRTPTTTAPGLDEAGQEWSYDAAYRLITHDEPRALVAIPLAGSTRHVLAVAGRGRARG